MNITKQNTPCAPRKIRNRHFLSYLVAAAIVAGSTLQVRAQEDNPELNPDTLPTNTVIATIAVGGIPGVMLIDPTDTFLYVTNSGAAVSKIATTSPYTVTNYSAGAKVIGLAITPSGKQLYVGNPGATGNTGSITILDAATGATINTINLTGTPTLFRISPNGKFAYVPVDTITSSGETGSLVVIGTATQKIKTTIGFGQVAVGSVVFNKKGTLAYLTTAPSSGNGAIAVIDTATLKVTQTVPISAVDLFAIVNPVTNNVWGLGVPSGSTPTGATEIQVVQGTKVIKNLTVPTGNAIGIPAFTPNGKYAYVPNAFLNGTASNYVYLMNTTTYKTVGTQIPVGNEPSNVVMAHSGKFAYVANQLGDSVSVIQITPAQ